MSENGPQRVAPVTGGTEGIGRCIAEKLRRDGFTTAVIVRRAGPLAARAAQGFDIYRGDVSDAGGLEQSFRPTY
jgi:NAD(P)-dependent dehydrogenase (short-subunit alcohol dehydrogenase family)